MPAPRRCAPLPAITPAKSPIEAFAHRKLSPAEVEELAGRMREKFNWSADPREHQLKGTLAQLEGSDLIVQAPTGSGKTAIAAGPHAWPRCGRRVTIMVCPLLVLENEMVRPFCLEYSSCSCINGRSTPSAETLGWLLSPSMARRAA